MERRLGGALGVSFRELRERDRAATVVAVELVFTGFCATLDSALAYGVAVLFIAIWLRRLPPLPWRLLVEALVVGAFAIAWAAGRDAKVRDKAGVIKTFASLTTIRGVAFLPKGYRLALAHYNGVSLWFPNAAAEPVTLEWKGSHLDVVASPDGRFVVSSMQENSLHGWRIADARNMRMTGYPTKVKSLSWSAKGKWLASSGAPAAIVWPFQSKDGPMGKAPQELGTRGDSMVTCVACHPSQDVVAIGYVDGMVMAVRIADAREVLLRRPGKGAITTMMWDSDERRIAFGSEAGDCGVIDIA